jgi:hypothetical protein
MSALPSLACDMEHATRSMQTSNYLVTTASRKTNVD